MKKFLKNMVFICFFIFALILAFNLAYEKFGYGYFSKAVSQNDITSFSRDSKIKYSDINSYKIENKEYNNATFYKTIKVDKNTPYKITCMVKTENVDILDTSYSNSGAKITILNSTEQTQSITGTSDWQKLTLMFNSKQNEEIEIGFMLGGDSEKGNVKGTAWFSDLKIEKGTLDSDNNWNFVCFIFKNTDVALSEGYYSYKMSEKDIEQLKNCMERFKNTCSEISNNLMSVTYEIIEIDNPIETLSYDEEKGYYVGGVDVSKYIDSYLENKNFDHIFICARLTDDDSSIPISDWIGLGNMEYKGIGFSNIRMPTSSRSYEFTYSKKLNKFPEEVFLHEFLHTLERNSSEYGYVVPELHAYEEYEYKQDKLESLYDWYKDYMRCEIASGTEKIGLNKNIYNFKPVNEENFKNSVELSEFNDATNTIERIEIIINTIKSRINT